MRNLVAAAAALLVAACVSGDDEVVTITETPSDPSTSTTATFAFTSASQRDVAFTCALDDGPEVACSAPMTYDGVTDYEHTFTVRAVSSRGTAMATASWRVDLDPPQRQVVTVHDRPYVAYQAPGSSFRVVCAEPCALDDRYLQARYQGFRRAHARLVAAMGIDVVPELWPVDLHLTVDAECPAPTTAAGYSWWNRTDTVKPVSCLFELEAATPPAPLVPRPLTEETALALRQQVLAAHEYGHTILFKRHMVSHEWLVQSLSFFVAGLTRSPCDRRIATAYELCKRNGFRFEDVAPTFQELDALYRSGQGWADWYGETTTNQLRHILDRRLGGSTFDAFLESGYPPQQIGEEPITITPAGGKLARYGGWLTLDVPPGAVTTPITIEYYPLFAAMAASSPEWQSFVFASNYPLAAYGALVPLAQPISITIRYDPTQLPAGGDPKTFGIYASTVQPEYSVAATNVAVDLVHHTVTGQITALATYALAPRP